MRGDIYMARKMYRDAIDVYRQSGTSAHLENKIGIAFQQMSELGLAKNHYEQAIKMDHGLAEAINNLGTVYYTSQSYRKAIKYFRRSLKCSGPVASVYANLGAAYFASKDYREASLYFDQALKLDPNVLEAHSGFGTRVQDRAVGEVALFHLYLARTYAKAGSEERALTYLRKALEEGLKERKKLADIPEFSALRMKPEFLDLLAQNPKPL
jgi:tetratricopeptide (TPR) repeat protein